MQVLRVPFQDGVRVKLQLSDKAQNIIGIGLLVMILATFATFLLWPDEEKFPPIFDVQMHYNREAWHIFSPRSVVGGMKELDVRAAVSSTPNEGTFRLLDRGSLSITPMLTPYQTTDDRRNWFDDPAAKRRLQDGLESGRYRGIGEIHIRDGQENGSVTRFVFEQAIQHNLYVLIHADSETLRKIFLLFPDLKVIWAHAGMTAKPYTVDGMMYRYPSLMVEMSHRTDLTSEGKLNPEWKNLFRRYAKRFMVGSGTYNNQIWYEYRYIILRTRRWLGQLPKDVAEDIGYRNAQRVFASTG
jgi:hypothetical protein